MSFIKEVVTESCFPWEEYTGHKVLANEDSYHCGEYGLYQFTESELFVEFRDETIFHTLADGSIPAPVVAQVIDLIVKNYREA